MNNLKELEYALECKTSNKMCVGCSYDPSGSGSVCKEGDIFKDSLEAVRTLVGIMEERKIEEDAKQLAILIYTLRLRSPGEELKIGECVFNTDKVCDEIVKALEDTLKNIRKE